MTMKDFDIERLTRNWDRAAGVPAAAPLPERLARVRVAQDPYPEAQRILERIGALSRAEFPRQERKLKPFIDRAGALLVMLRDSARPSAESAAGEQAQSDALRSDLSKVLGDLEDLFEVYSGIGLP